VSLNDEEAEEFYESIRLLHDESWRESSGALEEHYSVLPPAAGPRAAK
jgi:hypothetical protein